MNKLTFTAKISTLFDFEQRTEKASCSEPFTGSTKISQSERIRLVREYVVSMAFNVGLPEGGKNQWDLSYLTGFCIGWG